MVLNTLIGHARSHARHTKFKFKVVICMFKGKGDGGVEFCVLGAGAADTEKIFKTQVFTLYVI